MRRPDSSAHLLVWRSAVRIGSNLSCPRSVHSLYGHRNVRRGRTCRELCCSRRWPCADSLLGAGESCERILFHEMLLGQRGRGAAHTVWLMIRKLYDLSSRPRKNADQPDEVRPSLTSCAWVTGNSEVLAVPSCMTVPPPRLALAQAVISASSRRSGFATPAGSRRRNVVPAPTMESNSTEP